MQHRHMDTNHKLYTYTQYDGETTLDISLETLCNFNFFYIDDVSRNMFS